VPDLLGRVSIQGNVSPFRMAQQPLVGQGLLIFKFFRSHSVVRTIVGRNPLDEWSAPTQRPLLTTHNTHNSTFKPPEWFEPRNRNKRSARDTRLKA